MNGSSVDHTRNLPVWETDVGIATGFRRSGLVLGLLGFFSGVTWFRVRGRGEKGGLFCQVCRPT